MRWDEFAAAVPELAQLGEERLRAKELDLLRDPRLVVHSCTGALSRSSRAIAGPPTERRSRPGSTGSPRSPDYHVFAVDIDSAGFVTFASEQRYGLAWEAGGELRRWEQREA